MSILETSRLEHQPLGKAPIVVGDPEVRAEANVQVSGLDLVPKWRRWRDSWLAWELGLVSIPSQEASVVPEGRTQP